MEYQEAVSHLHSLTSLGIRPGLQRMERLLELVGQPHIGGSTRYIHIAGTNGKGSVAAMIDAMLRAAGERCGLFTSPHLHSHCERYRCQGENMPEEDFARLFSRVWPAMAVIKEESGESLTEFEAVTAVALLWFRELELPWAVLECGLGGRLDSTNLIQPTLTLITQVGMDHLDFLGDTIEQIAGEKAGILKPGVPLITAAQGPALRVIEERCQELGCPLSALGRDLTHHLEEADGERPLFTVTTSQRGYEGLRLNLSGSYQRDNAALAVRAGEMLGLPERAIRQGLAEVSWPGRLEVVCREPLIVLDGAHNEPGMAALAQSIRTCWPGKRICGLLGMLGDKQREQALAHLLPLLDYAYITPPPLRSRMGDWRRVADICQAGGVPAQTIENPAQALEMAVDRVKSGGYDMLLIAGSLYLLAEIREMLT